MVKDTLKEPGFCTCCDELVFDVLSKFPRDHVRYGEIAKLGKPDMDANRVTFLTVSGAQQSITLCGKCNVDDESIVDIFKKICRTNVRDSDPHYRRKMNARKLDADGEDRMKQSMIAYLDDPPIGVVSVMTWREVLAREKLRDGGIFA